MAAAGDARDVPRSDDGLVQVPRDYAQRHPNRPHVANMLEYHNLHELSLNQPKTFWSRTARELLDFSKDFQETQSGSFSDGRISWFEGGELNASSNCIDRHAAENPDKPALIFEGDEVGDNRRISFQQLLVDVCQLASVLKTRGVKRGDVVTIYLPMIPEAVVAILACTRIGAVHSVIFAGFSSESVRERVNDSGSRLIITGNEGRRGGRKVALKALVDRAIEDCPSVSTVLVCRRVLDADIDWHESRDVWWHEAVESAPSYLDPEPMQSEDPLFLLYTSGSTGKPKGLVHSTAGYLVGAAMTAKYVFDMQRDDIFFCAGDIGWITGHTYVVYAPLLLGCTTVVFEGTPTYPTTDRLWSIIRNNAVTQFYTAPTALRLLRQKMENPPPPMNSLRVLGSVGEPISPDVWRWYFEQVGRSRAHVVDTYWQTETGSHIIAPLAGVTPMKPGSACLPLFGIDPVLLDPTTGEELRESNSEGSLAIRRPWPSMARSIWGDHERFVETYLKAYKGFYFTGDSALRDSGGYIWIKGRMDDVVNVSGHRLSTAEIEAALARLDSVAEAAAVGVPDALTGQAVHVFASLKVPDSTGSHEHIRKACVDHVRGAIGPFAAPKAVHIVPGLPKTRSGKIMRRVLRKLLAGEEKQLGDTSTLADPTVIEDILSVISKRS